LNEQPRPSGFFDAHVFVCCNRRPDGHRRGSCAERGSETLRDYMKVRVKEAGLPAVRVNLAGCLDQCELGPVMVIYPESVWYRPATTADIDEIVASHLVGGRVVERLVVTPADKAAIATSE